MSRIERTAKELLMVARAGRATVEFHGPTMEPLLRDGDLLTLCAVSHGEIRRGVIVALRVSDAFPTCRVARVIGDAVVLSADNWPDFHATAAKQDIIGSGRGSHSPLRASQQRRRDRSPRRWLASPQGIHSTALGRDDDLLRPVEAWRLT